MRAGPGEDLRDTIRSLGTIDYGDTTPSPKDEPMTDMTKADQRMSEAMNAPTINGKAPHKVQGVPESPAPKSEASEVLGALPHGAGSTVTIAKDDDEGAAPNVMSTAMKIVRLLERHRTDEERGRVLLCVVAGSGMTGLGGLAAAVRGQAP